MTITFQKATKKQAKLRMALVGPSGSGKTFTALKIASALAGPEGRVAVLDTEHGSASKYADLFNFDVVELDTFAPENYIEVILAAQDAGYDVLIIDSLSHEWNGRGGALELVDKVAARFKGNSYMAWGEVTPRHNALTEAILASRLHVIVTMRSKTEYIIETVNGKSVPRKVGMAPVQRDSVEYDYDVVGELDHENTLTVTKTRCAALTSAVFQRAGADIAGVLRDWLTDGAPPGPDTLEKLDADREDLKKRLSAGADWTRTTGAAEKFFFWTRNLGLEDSEALTALGVKEFDAYAGSKEDARNAVNAYIAQRADAEPETEPQIGAA